MSDRLIIPEGATVYCQLGEDHLEKVESAAMAMGGGGITTTHRVEMSATEKDEKYAKDFFESIRKNVEQSVPDSVLEDLKVLGEKFHQSFDVSRGTTYDPKEVMLEECVAYIRENLRAGLHPQHLEESEKQLLEAMYGNEWYKEFGYDYSSDLKKYYCLSSSF